MSFGYLSRSLKSSGYKNISFLDTALYQLSPAQAFEKIKTYYRPDIIGIQVYTGAHIWAKQFISLVKSNKKNQNPITIVGGPHITALKNLALEFIKADYGIIGEGEKPIVALVKLLEGKISDPSKVDGLVYKKNGTYIHSNNTFGYLEDINEFPLPDWELLQPQIYFDRLESATIPLQGKKPAILLSSRGCPYKCTFCSSGLINKRKIRYRTPENIIQEMEFLKSKYEIDEILFTDDNLTMNLKRAEKIFDLMISRNVNLHWRAPNGIRLDRLNESLIEKMQKSGCYSVGVGIETGNDRVMKRIKKQLDLKKVKEVVKLLRKYKISAIGFFICGLISETEKEVNDSIKFALSVPFSRIQVSNYVPYPGSEDFDEIFKYKNEEIYEKRIMEFQETGLIPKFPDILPLKEVIKLQKRFILKFYLRATIISSMLRELTLPQIKSILKHPMIRRIMGFHEDLYSKPK
jgi:magnesium-protoporphyrin IX monomethyl ester (oxidative) cyclase